METISNYLTYIPKRIMALIAVVAIVVVPAITFAGFGPADRPTFTTDSPADYVTFNSITDNPEYGDERAFFDVKKYVSGSTTDVDPNFAQSGGFSTQMQVEDGDIIMFRAYVHNNAATSLNESGEGIARNTQFRAAIPDGQATAMRSIGFVSADNAQPQTVTDTADLYASTPFSLNFVPGSASMYSKSIPGGIALNDAIATTGVQLGQDSLDGNVPGCFESAVIVTYFAQVQMENYEVEKSVRFEGQSSSDWKNEITAKPGDTVEFRLGFKNDSAKTVNDVKIGDILPEDLSYVAGSTKLQNATYPGGVDVTSNNLVTGGINIGNYTAGSNAYVYFKATVADEADLECGANRLVNQMTSRINGGTYTDTASVNVTRTCEEPSPQTLICNGLRANPTTLNVGGTTTFKATATATNGATINNYNYTFGDGAAETNGETAVHTYTTAGTYNANVQVNGTVDGSSVTESGTSCAVTITVEEEPEEPEDPIYQCDAITASANIVNVGATVSYGVSATAGPADRATADTFTLSVNGEPTGVDTPVGQTQSVTHNTAGDIAVVATVTFTVDGNTKTLSPSACATSTTVEEEPVDPVYKCVEMTASKTSILAGQSIKYTVTAEASNGASIEGYRFVFGDDNEASIETTSTTATAEHTYATAGRYAAGVEVMVNVDGETKTITDNDCAQIVNVEEQPEEPQEPVYRCVAVEATQLADGLKARIKAIVFADNGAEASSVSFAYGDESDVFVSDNFVAGENGQQSITVDHEYAEAGTYNVTAVVTFTIDGDSSSEQRVTCVTKVTIDEQPEVCEYNSELTPDDPNCKEDQPEEEEEEKQVLATVLPNTGAASLFMGIFGTSALGTMIRSYLLSRKGLSASLMM